MALTPCIVQALEDALAHLDDAYRIARDEYGESDQRTEYLLGAWALVDDIKEGRARRG